MQSSTVEDYQLTLPIVQRILNAAYSDRTHMSSSQILFGNAINLDRSLFLPPVERPAQGHPLSAHMSKMLKFQDEVMEQARTILQESDSKHTATASAKVFTTFLPGTYVLAKYRKSSDLYPAPYIPQIKYMRPIRTTEVIICWKYDGARFGPKGSLQN
jgi:hypothetical protein